jgi:hypothetical protein
MGQYLAERQMAATLPVIQLYHPRLYLPAHHDALAGVFMDMGLEPLFAGIRDQMPGTSYLSTLCREAVCLDVRMGPARVTPRNSRTAAR